jgi:hypothetical protein
MYEDETVPPKTLEMIDKKQQLLKQPFNFYTFAVDINSEQRVATMNKVYNRLLEKELIDTQEELAAIRGELEPTRMMTKAFKQTEEESLKTIQELKQRYDMANDDRKADKIAFEKRLNQLIRDFVKVYKSLANEFKQYKEFTNFEMEIYKTQVFKKQQMIDNNLKMMEDYQLALRIPRQHFKHLEKLRFEEMIEQRDEIIKKMKKKGIDLTKKGSLI